MNDQSTEDLERQAETIRSQVVDTAESLRDKMSAGQLVEDFMNFSGSAGSRLLSGVGSQIQTNPLPFALIGIGMAWAIFGSPSGSGNGTRRGSQASGAGRQSASGETGRTEGWVDSAGQAATAVSSKIGSVIGDLPGAEQAQRSLRTVTDTVADQDPLLLAAMGLAFGTALGAMLPGTRLEDETFGRAAQSLRRTGEAQLEAGLEKVKEAAGSAVEAAHAAADELGLLPSSEGPTVADRLSDVAGSAVEAARDTLRGRD